MNATTTYRKPTLLILLFVTFLAVLNVGCGREAFSENTFVGKWRSSKVDTPIYLYDNGEWEIKNDSGLVLQYGIWEYRSNKIIWSYKWGTLVKDDVNPVLSATPTEFQVMENSGTTTTFTRLE